mmetsp:Transcript_38427/g.114108  ORF Transcript_38427/g.114108 Transcript_38427/m.114108 type:complete len:454 (+) Transcript_38427:283-1644(+)
MESEFLLVLIAADRIVVVVVTGHARGHAAHLPLHLAAPLGVVLLEAEELELLPPVLADLRRVLRQELQQQRGLLQDRVAAHAGEAHDAAGELGLLEHRVTDLLILEEGVEGVEELHYDLLVVALLHQELLQDDGQPGAGQVLRGIPLLRHVASQHDALQHDVVLGEAGHEQPREQVDEAGLAELAPGDVRQPHVREGADELHQQVRGVDAARGHAHKLVHPLGHPRALGAEELVHALADPLMPGHVPDDLAEQGVPRLYDAEHDLREESAAHHDLSCPRVRGEVHHERHQVLADARLREVDDELQQHHHAVPLVGHQRPATVVHGKVVEQPQNDVPEGRVAEEVDKQLHHAGFCQLPAERLVEGEVVEDPQSEERHAHVLALRQLHKTGESLRSGHHVLVVLEDAELLEELQRDQDQVVARLPVQDLGEELRHLPVHHLPLHGDLLGKVQESH